MGWCGTCVGGCGGVVLIICRACKVRVAVKYNSTLWQIRGLRATSHPLNIPSSHLFYHVGPDHKPQATFFRRDQIKVRRARACQQRSAAAKKE